MSAKIVSRSFSDKGRENWDRIFGKKKNKKETVSTDEWVENFEHTSAIVKNSKDKKAE